MLSVTVDGGEIRRRRERSGMTPTGLAAAAECSTQTVTALECGRRQPSVKLLARIANVLGCEPPELFADAGRCGECGQTIPRDRPDDPVPGIPSPQLASASRPARAQAGHPGGEEAA
jgi:transcriptional regulator with XRE-family HTH domain